MAKWNLQSTHNDLAVISDDPLVTKLVRQRRLRFLALFLVLGTFVAFGAKPAYRKIRNLQINRNLAAAQVAARLENWGEARNKARSVLLARPGDFEAFRIWQKALAKMGEPRTYMAAATLFTDPRATRADRLDALRVMALQAPQAVALGAYASMDEESRNDPSAIAAIAPLLIQRGETALVEKVLRASPALDSSPDASLELLRSLCSRPTPDRVSEAREIFAKLIADNASEQGLAALLILGDTPGGLASGPPLPPLSDWVNHQPGATTLHHLFALHPSIDAVPEASSAIFQSAIDRFIDVDPGTLGTWLILHGKSSRVVSLLAEAAKTSPSAYIARLQALLREKDSIGIAAALASPPSSVDLVDLSLVKAAAAHLQGDIATETNAWNQALNNAAFDQSKNRFIEIAKYAGLTGATGAIDDAWVAAIRIGWGQIPLYRDLIPVIGSLASKGRSEDLLAICRTLMRFEPQNPELINNYNYLALLHGGTSPSTAIQAQQELITKHPNAPEFRSVLAMAYLMNQQPDQALQQLPALRNSKRVAPLMLRALEGSALILKGETDRGRALLEGIDWHGFMRVENLAFRNMLIELEIQNLPLPSMELAQPALDPEKAPAWRAAVERLEKQRLHDVLPPLPAPLIPGVQLPESFGNGKKKPD